MTDSKHRGSIKVTTGSLHDLLARRAYETMNAGRWHDIEAVYADLGRLVPPGVAVRRNERDMRANRRTRASRNEKALDPDAPRVRPVTRDQQVASGRRAIVREFLNTGVGFDKSEDGRKIRMLRMPGAVRSDKLRGETLLPVLNSLTSQLLGVQDGPVAVERIGQVLRGTAHEWGIHLSSCPEDCELLPANKVAVTEGDDEG